MWNAGLDEAQAGIKVARRNINNLRYADDTTLMAESEKELKSLFMKEESELWHKSQQDPLWPTSQNIGNKSKNKQMGPNET